MILNFFSTHISPKTSSLNLDDSSIDYVSKFDHSDVLRRTLSRWVWNAMKISECIQCYIVWWIIIDDTMFCTIVQCFHFVYESLFIANAELS